jgi:hypothetical protein
LVEPSDPSATLLFVFYVLNFSIMNAGLYLSVGVFTRLEIIVSQEEIKPLLTLIGRLLTSGYAPVG